MVAARTVRGSNARGSTSAGSGARGLGPDDVQMIRDAVAAGRRPKVVFTQTAGQIAGQVGQVVALGDPDRSEEWVVVRFGRDELPFSPADLQIAPKGPVKKAAPPVVESPPARPEPEFVIDKPPVPSPRASATPATVSPAGAASRVAAGTASDARRAGTATNAGMAVPRSSGAGSSGAGSSARSGTGAVSGNARSGDARSGNAGSGGAVPGDPGSRGAVGPAGADAPVKSPRKATGRPAKAKGPSGLTVTLAYADGEWTVAAAQGAKALAKPYVIRPAEALKMVSLIDVPGVQEAVEQILSVERAEAEQQAQRLRAELAEIEARLAELRDAG